MNYEQKLDGIRQTLLEQIKEAAIEGNSDKIVKFSKALKETELMLSKLQDISLEIIELQNNLKKSQTHIHDHEESPRENSRIKHISAKAKGEIRRQDFIRMLQKKGIQLTQLRGVKYTSKNSNLVGIATASEKKKNRWFLGLPPDKYDLVVLLCEDENGKIFNISLPTDFISENIHRFSQDSNQQIKFNISKHYEKFFMTIPSVGNVDITHFLENYANL